MILVLTTTDKKSLAQEIGNELLKKKLVACASILPMESSYWWKGKIVNAKEFQLVLKTKPENFEKIEKLIKAIHTYELPEIISINIDKAGKDYLTWIEKEIG
ncbi:MAG: divalent-cation tolerance protein CutA [Patescibacteria group bacterium]